ncbi:MAG: zinc-ribbon domain-containing protein [Myxococcota bacterium]
MDVRCEQCGTEYEFDDDRLGSEAVTVKCATCGHVFKVRKEDGGSRPVAAPAGAPARQKSSNWMVRQPNGNIFTFKELTTLQKWIVERKVTRDDEISKSGETWKRLGNIAELASFFQAVDTPAVVPTVAAPPAPATPAPPMAMPPTVPPGYSTGMPPGYLPSQLTPAGAFPAPLGAVPGVPGMPPVPGAVYPGYPPGAVPPYAPPGYPAMYPVPGYPYPAVPPPGGAESTGSYPAPAAPVAIPIPTPVATPGAISPSGSLTPPRATVPAELSGPNPALDDDDPVAEWQRGQRRRAVLIGVALSAVVVGVGGYFLVPPELVQQAQAGLGLARPPAAVAAFEAARKSWLRSAVVDLESARQNADAALAASPRWGDALALKSLTESLLGTALGEEKAELSARLAGLTKATGGTVTEGTPDAAEAKALKERLDKTQAAELEHFKAAFELAKEALGAAPNDYLPNTAVAAYYVSRRVAKEAQPYLDRARSLRPAGDPFLPIILAEARGLDAGGRALAANDLEALLRENQDALVARWRLAALLEADGKLPEAGVQAELLLKDNAGHERAKAILAKARAAAAPPPAAQQAPQPVPAEEKPKEPAPEEAPKPTADKEKDKDAKPMTFDRALSLADKARDRGQTQKALALYLKANELSPDRAEPHVGLGWCYIDQEKMAAALGEFDRALQLNSRYAEAHLGLGEVHKFRGDKQNAIKHYKRYLDILPNGPDADVARNAMAALGGQ